MLLGKLREAVLEANPELFRRGLVLSTFGNASGVARREGLIVIKPSGVPYDELKPEHLVITDLQGKVIEGTLRPSSDLPTHAALYRAFPGLGGVAHTHSEYATAWAQARKPIPCHGTTHADYFHGPIPVTDAMCHDEINGEYEANTGAAIIRAFEKMDPMAVPRFWWRTTDHSPGALTLARHRKTRGCWKPRRASRTSRSASIRRRGESAKRFIIVIF